MSGWGSLFKGGSAATELRDVQTTILSKERCKQKYKNSNAIIEVCAGDYEEKDACKGDSGGPLVVKNPNYGQWYLHGITSWGRGCGDGAVYARTSAFKDWILEKIKKNLIFL